ncbi:MAG: 4Fe-4S dicluster domain-containing protein [Steroidobacteraceae bacterium]
MSPLIDRREFVKLMAAALALAESSCARAPPETLVPYAHQPEGLAAGDPLYFATALTHGGYAQGVLVRSQMGRPTKIEGNPHHPASLGSTGPIEQGRILELWDPQRSRACRQGRQIVGWDRTVAELRSRAQRWRAMKGRGVGVLMNASSSPTLRRMMDALTHRYPEMRVYIHEPFDREATYRATRSAFGRVLEPVYRFDRARIIVSLDADFLASLPGHVRYARDFADGRRPESGAMSRHYAAECTPTLTGISSDHHLALRPAELRRLASVLQDCLRNGAQPEGPWLRALVADLEAYRGDSLLLAGDAQPPELHELVYALNEMLGNVGRTLQFIEPVCGPAWDSGSLEDLVADLRSHRLATLLILGGNPLYCAPASLGLQAALELVPDVWHHGLYEDETAACATWHIPAAHELETWGDALAFDGTASLQQPLIEPLYAGHSVLEILGALLPSLVLEPYALVRETWSARWAGEMEERWREALHLGVVPDTARPAVNVSAKAAAAASSADHLVPPAQSTLDRVELLIRPDAHLWDGRYAPNAWLQELPRPVTQLTWGNAALMHSSLAERLGVGAGDLVELSMGGRALVFPVSVVARHARDSITLHAGGGRRHAGPVGTGIGHDVAPLQASSLTWQTTTVTARKAAGHAPLATVQLHHRMEGRDIVRVGSFDALAQQRSVGDPPHTAPSLYPPRAPAEYAWGMVIDLTACIGCNACTIACQAENNIPTVGRNEVLRGREMHWIRIDQYEDESAGTARMHFQPVPCMQCEHAPCELVCPVEASVHDPEGINVQVYNRCVGTRFCSNNCPYKVRRFNFLQYSQDDPALAAQRNPQVTVRMRGVMEKCNYCLQRVVRARIAADKEGRRVADGEVLTACQAVCPTRAITFGDLNDPGSALNDARNSARHYTLLEELNTRPRTTYLAKITNARSESEDRT